MDSRVPAEEACRVPWSVARRIFRLLPRAVPEIVFVIVRRRCVGGCCEDWQLLMSSAEAHVDPAAGGSASTLNTSHDINHGVVLLATKATQTQVTHEVRGGVWRAVGGRSKSGWVRAGGRCHVCLCECACSRVRVSVEQAVRALRVCARSWCSLLFRMRDRREHARSVRAVSGVLTAAAAPPFPKGSELANFRHTSSQPPQGSHERIPRLHLSPLMLFFLSASLLWLPERLSSPSRFRNPLRKHTPRAANPFSVCCRLETRDRVVHFPLVPRRWMRQDSHSGLQKPSLVPPLSAGWVDWEQPIIGHVAFKSCQDFVFGRVVFRSCQCSCAVRFPQ